MWYVIGKWLVWEENKRAFAPLLFVSKEDDKLSSPDIAFYANWC